MTIPEPPNPLPTITSVTFEAARSWCELLPERADEDEACGDGNARAVAKLSSGEEVVVFRYYDDEITFTAEELVGKTRDEARSLKSKKDVEFLQS